MKYNVTLLDRNDIDIDPSFYTIDLTTKTFTTEQNNLDINFYKEDGWTFETGSTCVVHAGSNCSFDTYHDCKLHTRKNCIFNVGVNGIIYLEYPCYVQANNCYTILMKRTRPYCLELEDLKISTLFLLHNWKIEFKSIQDAIDNKNHKDPFVRDICEKILNKEIYFC